MHYLTFTESMCTIAHIIYNFQYFTIYKLILRRKPTPKKTYRQQQQRRQHQDIHQPFFIWESRFYVYWLFDFFNDLVKCLCDLSYSVLYIYFFWFFISVCAFRSDFLSMYRFSRFRLCPPTNSVWATALRIWKYSNSSSEM